MRLFPFVAASLSLAFALSPAFGQAPRPQASASPPAPPAAPLAAAERDAVVQQLANELEANFVFPEVAAAYAKMLRERLRTNRYADLADPKAFASQVTADLQAVGADGHLRLNFQPTRDLGPGPGRQGPPGAPGEALAEAKMIGGLAYLKFNFFPNDPDVAARARKFLLDHADARGVILDARDSRGGTMMVMDAILPLLFAEKTTLVRLDTRAAAEARRPPDGEPPPTLVRQEAPEGIVRNDHVVIPDSSETRLRKVPVFYLTSKLTRSAAEHFAMALQRIGRGRVVGETTAGAGHYGGIVPLGERFSAFIPVGRSYDPDTGRGWEGTGITPNIPVPAVAALDEAIRRAGEPAAKP